MNELQHRKRQRDSRARLSSSMQSSAMLSSHNSEVVYKASGVTKSFGQIRALDGVELKIHKGEIVFITGASGAGKTTLLKSLGGIVQPDQGQLKKPGRGLFCAPIFQDLKLDENATCEKNLMVAYDPEVYKSKKEFMNDLTDLCKMLGVYTRLSIKAREANGGMRQKIAFIRALLTRPDIILADEPTAALDFENARKMFDILNLYNIKQGLTVIWATHNKELAKKFTGRIIHMDKGRLIYSGHACFI